jgi:CheY-like chemotaxis protein
MARKMLDAPQTWSLDSFPAKATARVPPARILVVGDPDALGRDLTAILTRQGHQVESLDPPQALASLRAEDADLLFTDLGTPDLTGWELASRARVLRPGLPVIVVTRYAPQLDQRRLQVMGVARILSRPYLEADVAQIVASTARPLSRAA